jgi:hypothetical protein
VEAHQPAAPRGDGGRTEDPEPDRVLARPDVGQVRAPAGDVVRQLVEHLQAGVDGLCEVPAAWLDEGVAPGGPTVADAGEVHRGAGAGRQPVVVAAEALQAADPHPAADWLHLQVHPDGQRPAGERAGHDGAGAPGREGPVDPEAGPAAVERGRGAGQQPVERGPEVVETPAGRGVHLDHVGRGQERPAHVVGDVEPGDRNRLLVDGGDLRDRHDATLDAEQFEDAEVLLALWLPALTGVDHEQAGVDRTHTGQHVLEEPDVAGHVDEGHGPPARQRAPGEAEVDGEAPGLLLGQAVGVGPGQAADQRGLPVVDVAGGGDDVHRVRRLSRR